MTRYYFRISRRSCKIEAEKKERLRDGAEPFSAVPTAFYVEVGKHAWWGNCIWDALGIPAMLKEDARVITACGCCNDAMTVEVRNGELLHPSGLVHFALPPKDWWKDVVFA
jgi:hypothetical protein